MYTYSTPYKYNIQLLIEKLKELGYEEHDLADNFYNCYSGTTKFEIKLFKKYVSVKFFKPYGKGPWQETEPIKLFGEDFEPIFKKLKELA